MKELRFLRSMKHFIMRRPRILNFLHRFRLVEPQTQTIVPELSMLGKYAGGARLAAEIGTFQGISAVVIAKSIAADGHLFCIDPWLRNRDKDDPSFSICKRHIARSGIEQKVTLLRNFSHLVGDDLPGQLDFLFIDGDHSLSGITADWAIAKLKVRSGGLICLHDVYVPETEPWRRLDSTNYFESVIQKDPEFRVVDKIHSLGVLRRA
jgi:predicted O-methyltransferase YrrM